MPPRTNESTRRRSQGDGSMADHQSGHQSEHVSESSDPTRASTPEHGERPLLTPRRRFQSSFNHEPAIAESSAMAEERARRAYESPRRPTNAAARGSLIPTPQRARGIEGPSIRRPRNRAQLDLTLLPRPQPQDPSDQIGPHYEQVRGNGRELTSHESDSSEGLISFPAYNEEEFWFPDSLHSAPKPGESPRQGIESEDIPVGSPDSVLTAIHVSSRNSDAPPPPTPAQEQESNRGGRATTDTTQGMRTSTVDGTSSRLSAIAAGLADFARAPGQDSEAPTPTPANSPIEAALAPNLSWPMIGENIVAPPAPRPAGFSRSSEPSNQAPASDGSSVEEVPQSSLELAQSTDPAGHQTGDSQANGTDGGNTDEDVWETHLFSPFFARIRKANYCVETLWNYTGIGPSRARRSTSGPVQTAAASEAVQPGGSGRVEEITDAGDAGVTSQAGEARPADQAGQANQVGQTSPTRETGPTEEASRAAAAALKSNTPPRSRPISIPRPSPAVRKSRWTAWPPIVESSRPSARIVLNDLTPPAGAPGNPPISNPAPATVTTPLAAKFPRSSFSSGPKRGPTGYVYFAPLPESNSLPGPSVRERVPTPPVDDEDVEPLLPGNGSRRNAGGQRRTRHPLLQGYGTALQPISEAGPSTRQASTPAQPQPQRVGRGLRNQDIDIEAQVDESLRLATRRVELQQGQQHVREGQRGQQMPGQQQQQQQQQQPATPNADRSCLMRLWLRLICAPMPRWGRGFCYLGLAMAIAALVVTLVVHVPHMMYT
ncbi:hypothetical protein F4677DRAFT_442730 [Hypoxylon crocopeplum]|nr:hypothetical protein F4677DRAFT_442730 [Hypoxylon crocopeplum]